MMVFFYPCTTLPIYSYLMNSYEQPHVPEQESENPYRETVLSFFTELGVQEEDLHPVIVDRLALIEERYQRFNDDSRMICWGLDNLFTYFNEDADHHVSISPDHIRKATIAAVVHDVGKSGPHTATPEQQKAVIDLYGVEKVRDGSAPIASVLQEKYSDQKDVEDFLHHLEGIGVSSTTTMREFWNLHGVWTHDILENNLCDGIDGETRVIAGSHHIAEGINPYHVPDSQIPLGAVEIGAMENYLDILEERSLIVIDKYQANRRRSGTTHEQAMQTVRTLIENKFDHDPIMQFILTAIDSLGSRDLLFVHQGK